MTRTTTILSCGLLFLASGCGQSDRAVTEELDCAAVESPYEFLAVHPSPFSDSDPGWYQYADPTPGGVPNTLPAPDGDGPNVAYFESTKVKVDRCDDTTGMLRFTAYGHNFWGAGFGNWALNKTADIMDASAYEGISFWVRSEPNADKSFLFYVDDPRTMLWSNPTVAKDLDGDGTNDTTVPVLPGEVAEFTECLFPPPVELGEAACYNGGMNAPSAVTRVPAVNECGNAFHTVVDMTEEWQLVLIPWSKLAQWPCPNRLDGGIDTTRISKFEIKLEQGTNYDFWIDNIAFYKRR